MKKGSIRHLQHLRRVSHLGGLARAEKYKRPTIDRFMENIRKDENGCWIWTKNLSRGYGAFKVDGKKSPVKATRWAYEYFKKEKIPSSRIFVCHKCDVRACCNPDHLFLGTTHDNMRDAMEKDRFKRGSAHPASRLTEEQVKEMRDLRSKGVGANILAVKFKVSRERIWSICKGIGWRHIL